MLGSYNYTCGGDSDIRGKCLYDGLCWGCNRDVKIRIDLLWSFVLTWSFKRIGFRSFR